MKYTNLRIGGVEHQKLAALAEEAGITRSELVRRLIHQAWSEQKESMEKDRYKELE